MRPAMALGVRELDSVADVISLYTLRSPLCGTTIGLTGAPPLHAVSARRAAWGVLLSTPAGSAAARAEPPTRTQAAGAA